MKKMTLTQLRKNLYHAVDGVVLSGKPLVIQRKDSLIQLVLMQTIPSKLSNLRKNKTVIDPMGLDNQGPVFQWNEPQNL